MLTADAIRTYLIFDIFAMALLAYFYLRQRRMSWAAYCLWILITLLLPVLGPFLVIATRPGVKHPDPFPSAHTRQQMRAFAQKVFHLAGIGTPILPNSLDTSPIKPVRRRHPKRIF